MRTLCFELAGAVAFALAAYSTLAESALMGWQTAEKGGQYVYKVHMLGPTQRNKVPERKGSFKGEYFCRKGEWRSTLVAVYKVSFNTQHGLQSDKVEFTVSPPVAAPHEPDGEKVDFTTHSLSFGDSDSFLLVFKTKAGTDKEGKALEGTEMVLLPIVPVFVPS